MFLHFLRILSTNFDIGIQFTSGRCLVSDTMFVVLVCTSSRVQLLWFELFFSCVALLVLPVPYTSFFHTFFAKINWPGFLELGYYVQDSRPRKTFPWFGDENKQHPITWKKKTPKQLVEKS